MSTVFLRPRAALINIASAAMLGFVLGACGQTGELRLPDTESTEPTTKIENDAAANAHQ